ncbi:DegT/DnrJ/EryC1/StrS family aminotransferase [Jiangella asiatica]|uniref:DegT/DnrJ/EryC1/StrS family aminotransferase n=1 Tax=Jiangella asiatica TaxID=2530372 RepID=A0A4R5DAM7_9ACTN|nr:DegT/DnrJ/EryC1/StrS family aminotransferase [Jiangella asiatica]TDE10696.1 DegT/DnrJ/EryC1/StrS family aminotransferase [Jiangella asiatica]
MTKNRNVLAIDGGVPIRTKSFPHFFEPDGRRLGDEEVLAVERVVRRGKLSSLVGPETRALETEFADYYGIGHAMATSSGTAALHLAVAAVGLEPGDEVITTPLTDSGTILPILWQNAVPVFADVDPHTGNLDIDSVAARITSRTRALIVVHLFGQPAPVAELRALADTHGLMLIEDCAQAYRTPCPPDGALAGTIGHVGCFSLQQTKHITAGEGGLTITDDADLARRAGLFADKGWPRGVDRTHLMLGLNYKMTELHAAVAREQLKKLDDIVDCRQKAAEPLVHAMKALDGVETGETEGMSYWAFPVIVDPELLGVDARRFSDAVGAEGVPTFAGFLSRPFYLEPVLTEGKTYGTSGYPLSSPPASSAPRYREGLCPNAEELIYRRLFLILWNENYTDEDVADIVRAMEKVHSAFRER